MKEDKEKGEFQVYVLVLNLGMNMWEVEKLKHLQIRREIKLLILMEIFLMKIGKLLKHIRDKAY